jgi:uncharacterized phage protein (TIGR01671 family)
MREYKFRLWDKKYNVIWYQDFCSDTYITLYGKVHEIGEYSTYGGGGKTVDDVSEQYEIMQYTGLNDKNCKEIYEGDILKYSYRRKEETLSRLFIVSFDNGCFICLDKNSKFYSTVGYYATLAKGNDLEVIGNIYENPELLGV